MRKRLRITLSLCLIFTLILLCGGCGNTDDSNMTSTDTAENITKELSEEITETSDNTESTTEQGDQISEETNEDSETSETGSDVLVVYFSRTGEQYGVGVIDEGNTAIVAKMIAESTGADTFEILPVDDHYPMTYDELTDVAKQEQNDNARPAYISDQVPDLSKYKTIFIGAPVWWGDWPMICYTFFENEDLSGKTLYPFSTHAGSGLSGFDSKLASAVPGSTVGEGLAITGSDCQNDKDNVKAKVNEWLSGIGF